MTQGELAIAVALSRCSFPIASFAKRFARELKQQAMQPTPTITEKQAACARRLVTTYRRQIRPEALLEADRQLLVKE